MTNLQALQSQVEYDNDEMFEKALLDNDVTPSSTYCKANKKVIDLALADVYLVMAALPEFKQGSHLQKYDSKTLLSMRAAILRKYDEVDYQMPTIESRKEW